MTIPHIVDMIGKICADDNIVSIEMLDHTISFKSNHPTGVLMHTIINQENCMPLTQWRIDIYCSHDQNIELLFE